MSQIVFKKIGLAIIITISVGIWSLLIWEHFHGGVPSHSFLARKDMPAISNWWGGLLLPLLTYLTLYRIQKRIGLTGENAAIQVNQLKHILLFFVAGLMYSGLMAYFFAVGKADLTSILFQGLFLLAFFFPLYRAEFFLGFVLGLLYTFGAILPTFIASFFALVSYIAHKYIYVFVLRIFRNKNDRRN